MQSMRKIVLMSIRPQFANRILFGVKLYEYRKRPISIDTKHIIVYMTSPVMKIVGVAKVKQVLQGAPSTIWELTKKGSGITRAFYREYFAGKKHAYAIEIEDVQPFNHWIDPKQIDVNFSAPQSFYYVDQNFYDSLFNATTNNNSLSDTIFFGGIHGVGKSTFCKKLKRDIGINTYSASQLIKDECKNSVNDDKKVKNIKGNQQLLLKALQNLTRQGSFILDGHFCLLNMDNSIERIPIEVFKQINPRELLLLEGEPLKILNNLKKRDKREYKEAFLVQLLEEERKYAEEISMILQIPLRVFQQSDYTSVRDDLILHPTK